MNISKELLEKARTANSAEELLAMAKAENLNLTEEEASKAFAEFNKTGELSDEELDNVSGGGCGDSETDGGNCAVAWLSVVLGLILAIGVVALCAFVFR